MRVGYAGRCCGSCNEVACRAGDDGGDRVHLQAWNREANLSAPRHPRAIHFAVDAIEVAVCWLTRTRSQFSSPLSRRFLLSIRRPQSAHSESWCAVARRLSALGARATGTLSPRSSLTSRASLWEGEEGGRLLHVDVGRRAGGCAQVGQPRSTVRRQDLASPIRRPTRAPSNSPPKRKTDIR